jgi:hypothetical protein
VLPVPDFDPIKQTSRFVLGETESAYGVWDKRAGTELVEDFPLTDEGFEQAAARFDELKRRDRSERGIYLYVLWAMMLAGAALGLVAGILEGIGAVFPDVLGPNLFTISFAVGSLGYRMAVGGLALLAGLALLRRLRLRSVEPSDAGEQISGWSAWQGVARWILTIALAVWVAGAVVTNLVFEPPFTPFGPGGVVDRAAVIAVAVESLAFRVWVTTLTLLAVASMRRLLAMGSAGSSSSPE